MPRLLLFDSGIYNLNFVTTKARKGKIKIAGQEYNVLLGHAGLISGMFDNPWTALYLLPRGRENQRPDWINGRMDDPHPVVHIFRLISAQRIAFRDRQVGNVSQGRQPHRHRATPPKFPPENTPSTLEEHITYRAQLVASFLTTSRTYPTFHLDCADRYRDIQ